MNELYFLYLEELETTEITSNFHSIAMGMKVSFSKIWIITMCNHLILCIDYGIN